jgi:hypothetical protein
MRWLVAALLFTVACRGTDPEGDAAFPSRDWSGVYRLQVAESSTDCLGAEAPPALTDDPLEVRQTVDNHAVVKIGPLMELTGRFDGDKLEAHAAIIQPISLPESLAARTAPQDSLETIAYAIEVVFGEDPVVAGRYVIRAPDLVALARGTGAHRCQYVYEVRGGGNSMIRGRDRAVAEEDAARP